MLQIWVALLRVSDRTAEKLMQKHGLDADEVRDAVQCVRGLRYVWDEHPDRGVRALVETSIRRRRVLVVLYPTDEIDVWHLGSAYFV